jgi:AcrR family transcriptional regulator
MAALPQPQLRADARRNRERIVTVAAECFASEGVECQVAEIARRAGVGNATVFRHFPTKVDLVTAVVEAKLQDMVGVADEALAMDDPDEALRHFVDAMCASHVRDHGLKQMAACQFNGEERLVGLRDALLGRLGHLVEQAKAAGCVRPDAEAVDFAVMVNGVASAVQGIEEERPGLYRRYLEIAYAGLRPQEGAADTLSAPAPTAEELDAGWQRQAQQRGASCTPE